MAPSNLPDDDAQAPAEAPPDNPRKKRFFHIPGGALPVGTRVIAYLMLFLVMGSVAAMSWSGTYGWAQTDMHWTDIHAALVPISLDIAAIACSFLALDAISDGESGVSFRVLAAAFVALSAFTNWRFAIRTHEITQEIFFPAMSILAYLIVHLVFERIRRRVKRADQQGGDSRRRAVTPLPRLGLLPWLPVIGHPLTSLRTIREAVRERLPELEGATKSETPEVAHRDIPATVVLEGLTQADAIRKGIATVGPNPRQVVAWLDANGWPEVAPQRVYDVLRRDNIRAVSTGEMEAI